MSGICFLTMPGPLSWTPALYRLGPVASIWTQTSGTMPASSQASSELSTASLTAVRRAFLGLSKPSRCLFFAKNSLTDMSRCFAAIDSAVTARRLGCSPVFLTLGIFVCSSILPDSTLVLHAPSKQARKHKKRNGSFHLQALSLDQTLLVPGRSHAVLVVR